MIFSLSPFGCPEGPIKGPQSQKNGEDSTTFSVLPLISLITCRTGLATRYFSRNALGATSYFKHVARCLRMDSMVCLGCCLVMRRYFCSGRAIPGKIVWAVS